jgi:hypothetical protein
VTATYAMLSRRARQETGPMMVHPSCISLLESHLPVHLDMSDMCHWNWSDWGSESDTITHMSVHVHPPFLQTPGRSSWKRTGHLGLQLEAERRRYCNGPSETHYSCCLVRTKLGV